MWSNCPPGLFQKNSDRKIVVRIIGELQNKLQIPSLYKLFNLEVAVNIVHSQRQFILIYEIMKNNACNVRFIYSEILQNTFKYLENEFIWRKTVPIIFLDEITF